jgi:hypothetical protein
MRVAYKDEKVKEDEAVKKRRVVKERIPDGQFPRMGRNAEAPGSYQLVPRVAERHVDPGKTLHIECLYFWL